MINVSNIKGRFEIICFICPCLIENGLLIASNTIAYRPKLADPGGRKINNTTITIKDKADRATSEQVLDPRTRYILFRLLANGVISQLDGCISTGKEANVYHAVVPDSTQQLALKIYKTSILTFKDRDRYVSGEYRFRNGYGKHNPRKMVKLWAEKEFRNLKRLRAAQIPCPEVIALKLHVLIMTFLGDADGW